MNADDDNNTNESLDSVVKRLQTNLDTGLTSAEAAARLERNGPNEIPEHEATLLQRILKRLWGPIPWMIESAAILSAVVGKWEDFAIILFLLCVNVIVDFAQESKALSALKVLKNQLAKKAIAKRDGTFTEIDSRKVVPGDVIKLTIGAVVSADVVLAHGDYVQVDQAALTGESLPVNKKVGDSVYGNSVVKMGEMEAVVTLTGPNTYFGKTASLVARATKTEKSHFQRAVIRIGNNLMMLTGTLAVLLIVVSLVRHDPILEVLRFILVLVVASIPVALPAVLSVTLAVGAMALARKHTIVSRLAAIEELAGVDTLCSDKTGTLTQNTMSIGDPILFDPYTADDLYLYAALASRKENDDPIEKPIFEKTQSDALKARIAPYARILFTPFDPIGKRTEATVKNGDGTIVTTKGAPQVIAGLCNNDTVKQQVASDVETFASKGYRTLGVAVRSDQEKSFHFVGLIPFFDPPREDSKETIAEAKQLGLRVKMITGDNHAIAQEIAHVLDIGDKIIDTNQIRIGEATKDGANATTLSPERTLASIESADGFSQVLPEDKFFIIDELQKAGHIVAMTGDGVNDAPALKKADAGIAVSGATDAARAAADLVLLQPGLAVIIEAIKGSRMVFERMRSYATFRIAETLRIILFMSFSILVFNFYPVTAVMIIILALLNDIPIMMIAYDNTVAQADPVRWDMREVMTVASVLGLMGVIASFLLYYYLEANGYAQALIQTLIFLKLDVAGHSTIYVTRSGEHHFWHKPYPARRLLFAALGTRVIGTAVAYFGIFMQPISLRSIGFIWLYATAWFVVNDFVKVWTFKLIRSRRTRTHTPALTQQ